MNISREHYLKILTAGKKCQQVFIKQDTNQVESAIDALIAAYQSSTVKFPLLTGLILNLTDSKFDYLTNLIVKQVSTTSLIASNLNYQLSAQNSYIKASLIVFYVLTKPIISAKKSSTKKKDLQVVIESAKLNAFVTGRKVGIKDQDCLKILSLLSKKNRYFNTNQLAQSLILSSVNTNLLANLGLFSMPTCFNEAYSLKFTSQRLGQLSNPFLLGYAKTLSRVVNDNTMIGNVIVSNKQEKLLIVDTKKISDKTNNVQTQWICFPLTKLECKALVSRSCQDVKVTGAQPKFDICALIDKLERHKSLLIDQVKPAAKSKTTALNSPTKYEPSDEWREITKVLQYSDTNKLVKKMSGSNKFTHYQKTILKHASSLNREKMKVSDLKHAVNLLGSGRLLPIVVIAALKARQNAFAFNGSSIVNNKIELFSEISQAVAKSNKKDIPEYMGVVGRLLFLGLITIPKACFAVASPISLTQNTNGNCISLADIYGIKDVSTWKTITCHLAKLWFLPKHQQSLLTAYFHHLTSKQTQAKSEKLTQAQTLQYKKHQNEIKLLDQSTEIFFEITEEGLINPNGIEVKTPETDNSIDALLLADQGEIVLYPKLSTEHMFTPLS